MLITPRDFSSPMQEMGTTNIRLAFAVVKETILQNRLKYYGCSCRRQFLPLSNPNERTPIDAPTHLGRVVGLT